MDLVADTTDHTSDPEAMTALTDSVHRMDPVRHPVNVAGEPRRLHLAATVAGMGAALFIILSAGHYSASGQLFSPVLGCCAFFLAIALALRHAAIKSVARYPAKPGDGSFVLPALSALICHLALAGVVFAITPEIVTDEDRAGACLGLYLGALAALVVRGTWGLLRAQTGWVLPVLMLDASLLGALVTIVKQDQLLEESSEYAVAFAAVFVALGGAIYWIARAKSPRRKPAMA